jgi:GTP-binding protein Era
MSDPHGEESTRCGLVALVGRPNVGKSTLLNHLLGMKLSITSRKPQTTRSRLLGIKTVGNCQLVFVDTPGFHTGFNKAINRQMNNTVSDALQDVDLVVYMTDRLAIGEEDVLLLDKIQRVAKPVFLVINKVDELPDREALLPFIAMMNNKYGFAEVFPVSALKNQNTVALEQGIVARLPENPWLFPEDQLTDRNLRFLVAEFIREKITRQMGDELPYEVAVEIEEFSAEPNLTTISALILVQKSNQKQMIIGDKGSRLKLIGTEARKDIERLLETRVMLNLWVKVKRGWSDDERALRSLGYGSPE